VRLLADADTSHWEIGPGAADALAGIDHPALLTGNRAAVAHARLDRLGLAHFFPDGQGAFGCEREDRVALFPLARERGRDELAHADAVIADLTELASALAALNR
jgi:phosphoglycolate phosphatase-like HAD superfamily hydrolase